MGHNDIWMRSNGRDPVEASYADLGYAIALQCVRDLKAAAKKRHTALRKYSRRSRSGIDEIRECAAWLQSDECELYCGRRFNVREIARMCNDAIAEMGSDGRRNNGRKTGATS